MPYVMIESSVTMSFPYDNDMGLDCMVIWMNFMDS